MDSVSKSEFREFKLLVYALLYIIIANVTKSQTLFIIAEIAAGISLVVLFGSYLNHFFKLSDDRW